jgi:hypothetical protein
MASVDAAWLRMDRATNPMVVNVLLWYERPVDWRALRAIVGDQVDARKAAPLDGWGLPTRAAPPGGPAW